MLGTLFLVQLSSTSLWGTINLTLAFWCFSLALNVLATVIIVGRLLVYRRRLACVKRGRSSAYLGVVAMVVESELLYTGYLILYIVPFVLGHPLANIFVQTIGSVQVCSPLSAPALVLICSMLTFCPNVSCDFHPNSRSAVLLKSRIRPASSITIIASGTVSRIDRKCASRRARS